MNEYMNISHASLSVNKVYGLTSITKTSEPSLLVGTEPDLGLMLWPLSAILMIVIP